MRVCCRTRALQASIDQPSLDVSRSFWVYLRARRLLPMPFFDRCHRLTGELGLIRLGRRCKLPFVTAPCIPES